VEFTKFKFSEMTTGKPFLKLFPGLTLDVGELSRIDQEEGLKSEYDQLGYIKIEVWRYVVASKSGLAQADNWGPLEALQEKVLKGRALEIATR